jgi:hypothetical protein
MRHPAARRCSARCGALRLAAARYGARCALRAPVGGFRSPRANQIRANQPQPPSHPHANSHHG